MVSWPFVAGFVVGGLVEFCLLLFIAWRTWKFARRRAHEAELMKAAARMAGQGNRP
jgi:hypothetical protein